MRADDAEPLPPRQPRRPGLAAGLGLGAAACSEADESQPTAPATGLSPNSSAQRNDANTVPPGVSGEGSKGGEGEGESSL